MGNFMKKLLALFLTLLLSAAAQKAAAVAEPALLPFQDVKQGDWFYDAVSYAYGEKLFQGVSASSFNPSGQMDRAMFVTVLANLAGADTSSFTQQHFTDTAPGQWYTENVEWAASFGIVSGMGNFQFAPRSPITREQMAALLYRFAEAAGNDMSVSGSPAGFTDYNKISSYAKTAMDWAISKKLIRGLSETVLDPQGTATRAQAAQIFCNAQSVLLKKQVAAPPVALPLPTEIDKKLYTMTLEEKVGQLFLPRFPGKDASTWTKGYFPAGYVLFAKDFSGKTKAQVQNMLSECQSASKTPLLLGVDEEGGTVVRVSSNKNLASAPFASPQKVYQQGGVEGIKQDTEKKAALLLDLGLNLNLAPVCDISTDPGDYIYARTLGVPAEEAAQVTAELVGVMEKQNLSSTLKHFPGYGNNLDTHTGIAVDERPYQQFQEEDFLPFAAGIEAGAPSVLVSHNIINCMDPSKPASLSKPVHDILREELGFEGVVMTDDLSMDAIKLYTNRQSPAVAAFLAGNDLLLTSDWKADYDALLAAAKSGEIPLTRIEESVRRTLEWKAKKGLL